MIETVTLERGQPSQRKRRRTWRSSTSTISPTSCGRSGLEVDEDGGSPTRWELEDYWTKPAIPCGSSGRTRTGGLCRLDPNATRESSAELNMAQFFVMRPYRGLDVAGRAVEQPQRPARTVGSRDHGAEHPGSTLLARARGAAHGFRYWETREHVGEARRGRC